MKSKNTNISFSLFLGSVALVVLAYIIGSAYGETGIKLSEGNGWLGYVFLVAIFILPIIGLVVGFKGEKNLLKYVAIVCNLLAFLTVGLLSVVLIVYDFIPQ